MRSPAPALGRLRAKFGAVSPSEYAGVLIKTSRCSRIYLREQSIAKRNQVCHEHCTVGEMYLQIICCGQSQWSARLILHPSNLDGHLAGHNFHSDDRCLRPNLMPW